MPDDDAVRRTARLIDRFSLHRLTPVPIRHAVSELGWMLVYRERIDPIYCVLAIVGEAHVLLVNASLAVEWQRVGIAHEIGHWLNDDRGGLHLLAEHPDHGWWDRDGERAANVLAAQLLLPADLLRGDLPAEEIARICEVPIEFVAWTRGC